MEHTQSRTMTQTLSGTHTHARAHNTHARAQHTHIHTAGLTGTGAGPVATMEDDRAVFSSTFWAFIRLSCEDRMCRTMYDVRSTSATNPADNKHTHTHTHTHT